MPHKRRGGRGRNKAKSADSAEGDAAPAPTDAAAASAEALDGAAPAATAPAATAPAAAAGGKAPPVFEYNRLFVGNVDNANVSESQIRNIFSQYGTLTKVEVEHGFAFITFESEACSRTALETENGKKYGNRCLCLFLSARTHTNTQARALMNHCMWVVFKNNRHQICRYEKRREKACSRSIRKQEQRCPAPAPQPQQEPQPPPQS